MNITIKNEVNINIVGGTGPDPMTMYQQITDKQRLTLRAIVKDVLPDVYKVWVEGIDYVGDRKDPHIKVTVFTKKYLTNAEKKLMGDAGLRFTSQDDPGHTFDESDVLESGLDMRGIKPGTRYKYTEFRLIE
ncbi:MAG: hypothetical protein MPK62_01360 [Alphaproteobacteria bacterium]|nr:hypothetical protein [Alphaproteobacteria bacterium]